MTSEKRTAILNATLQLTCEQGFHGAPMSMIAERAEVGAGTIYRYFDNKEALLNELFLELKKAFSQRLLDGFSTDLSPKEQFCTAWLNIYNYCIQHPDEMSFLEQYHNSPLLTPETEAETLRYIAPLAVAFQSAIDEGEVKDMPFEMLGVFVYDTAVALAKRYIAGSLRLNESKQEMAARACWDAVKTG